MYVFEKVDIASTNCACATSGIDLCLGFYAAMQVIRKGWLTICNVGVLKTKEYWFVLKCTYMCCM